MIQTNLIDQAEGKEATDGYTVLPTVKKASLHEPKIELLNIDCLHYMKQCEDKQFDLAIVDPPYGIGASADSRVGGSYTVNMGGVKRKVAAKTYTPKDWDFKKPTIEYWQELKRVSKNQIVWGGNYMTEYLPPSPCWLIWDKMQEFTGAVFEMAWTSFKSPAKAFRMSRVEAYANKNKIHPTQKPIQL